MARDNRPLRIRTLVILAIVVALGVFVFMRMKGSGSSSGSVSADPKVTLGQCLTDAGVKFYGASWCPHCQSQKKDFGTAAMKKVTYVECALAGGQAGGQAQVCKDANIQSYPTWTFADGTRLLGVQSMEDLAEKAGCAYGEAPSAAAGTVETGTEAGDEPAAE